jgi:response regulator RpfG family c-di-GMP phosphodiesterase
VKVDVARPAEARRRAYTRSVPRFRALVLHPDRAAIGELTELLAHLDLAVEGCASATEATRRLRLRAPHAILAAHDPPGLDGIAFLDASVTAAPDALRVLLVEAPGVGAELEHRPAGAPAIVRFIARAGQRSHLTALIGEAIKLLGLVEEQRSLVARLASEHERLKRRGTLLDVVVKERTKELEDSYLKLKEAHRQALFGLAEAIEAKDPYTKGHCGRVAAYALVLAQGGRLPRRRARDARVRRVPPRHRQDRHPRRGAAQARPARRRRVGPHARAPGEGLRDRVEDRDAQADHERRCATTTSGGTAPATPTR